MDIIPAIDIIDGKCVRLTKGDFSKKTVYHGNPLEVALQFQDAGISRLHLVDLDGARTRKVVNLNVLENLAAHTELTIDFGGGVQSTPDMQRVLDAGASQVTAGSIAVKNPLLMEEWLVRFGPDKVILGADVIDEHLAISGWQENTGLDLWEFLKNYRKKGVQYVICTDVNKDGLLQGPSTSLYNKIVQQFPGFFVIASGGVTTVGDLQQLESCGVHGAIIGKALYEQKISLDQLTPWIC